MGAEWINYKGKKILYIKYAGLEPEEMLVLIRQATQMLVDSRSDQNLTLTDVSSCYLDQAFVNLSKTQSQISLPLTKKAAIVGVTGLKNILLQAVNRVSSNPRVSFATVEEAKDWLVK